MTRFTAVGCWLLTYLLSAVAAFGQESAPRITAVDFEGLIRATPTFARDVARIQPGEPATTQDLDEAVARLIRTGRFFTVAYELSETPEGARVLFKVRERPLVTAVRVQGNIAKGEKQLVELVGIKVGDAVDLFAAREGRASIAAVYRDDAYMNVKVSLNEALFLETGELVYIIEEGTRVRIREIRFEGNEPVPPSELLRSIETKTALWIFRTGAYDKDTAEADAGRIRKLYQDNGHLDARVTHRTQIAPNGEDMTVTFIIDQGVLYSVESIEFRGHTVFSEEEMIGMTRSRVGQAVLPPQVEADAKSIQDRYGALGYIYARVRVTRVFSEAPGRVRLTFTVEEGERFRMGRVVVRGNTRTKDNVVRRALNLYPPDDFWDLTETREAEKRLTDTRIFSSARVTPVGEEKGVRDAVIDVQEADKSGDFLFGAGVTSNNGVVGSIVLDIFNFDLHDWPQNWTEFVKFRSFTGAGQRLRIELQPGTEVNRFRIDFTEPYLFDRPLRFDASAYLFQRGRDGYNERRVGSVVSFGKRFDRGLLLGWYGEGAFRLEQVRIDDVDVFAARDIRDAEGDSLLTSIKGSLVRDRTDNRLLPTAGDRLSLAYEQFGAMGGDDFFGKVTSEYTWFTTLATDLLDRKTVLQLKAEGGVILGDAPVFERFYAGGTGSVRGFEFRGIGEYQGISDNNIGGDFLVLLGAEYSYPIYSDNVRGHFFIDTGQAGRGPYRAAVGAGVRVLLNLLGPVPLEFNLGFPLLKDDEDDEQVFSFLIGRVF